MQWSSGHCSLQVILLAPGTKRESLLLACHCPPPPPPFSIPYSENHLFLISFHAHGNLLPHPVASAHTIFSLRHIQNLLPTNTIALPGRNLMSLTHAQHTLLEVMYLSSSHVPVTGYGSSLFLLSVNICHVHFPVRPEKAGISWLLLCPGTLKPQHESMVPYLEM